MSSPQRVLVLTGLFLIAFTMAFGVWYAIFDEHQTLVGMGVHMATGFAEMAAGNPEASTTALENYAALSREYGREVHAQPDSHVLVNQREHGLPSLPLKPAVSEPDRIVAGAAPLA